MSERSNDPEFWFKLGHLMGTLDDFLIRVDTLTVADGDVNRVKTLVKDVKKKFYQMNDPIWNPVNDKA